MPFKAPSAHFQRARAPRTPTPLRRLAPSSRVPARLATTRALCAAALELVLLEGHVSEGQVGLRLARRRRVRQRRRAGRKQQALALVLAQLEADVGGRH